MSHIVGQDFLVRIYRRAGEMLIAAEGVLRLSNGDSIKNFLLETMRRDDAEKVFLHMGAVRELDSAGLGVLVGVHMTARKLGVEFQILNPTPYQMKLFETTRLNSILKIQAADESQKIIGELEKPEYEVGLDA